MKKDKMHVHYDKEGDVLEIRIGKPTVGYLKDLGEDVFEKIDQKTREINGFVIVNFKKRSGKNSIDIPIPANLKISA